MILKSGLCTTCKKVQPRTILELGRGKKNSGKVSGQCSAVQCRRASGPCSRQTLSRSSPPYLTSRVLITFQMEPCGIVHILYIFVNFKEFCRALPDPGRTLCFGIICICSQSSAEVFKVPSAGQVEILWQTHFMASLAGTVDNKGPLIDLCFKFSMIQNTRIFGQIRRHSSGFKSASEIF